MKKTLFGIFIIILMIGTIRFSSAYLVTSDLHINYQSGDFLIYKETEYDISNNTNMENGSLISQIEITDVDQYTKYLLTNVTETPDTSIQIGMNVYKNTTYPMNFLNTTQWNLTEHQENIMNHSAITIIATYIFPNDVDFLSFGNKDDVRGVFFESLGDLFVFRDILLMNCTLDANTNMTEMNNTESFMDFSYGEYYNGTTSLNGEIPFYIDFQYGTNITYIANLTDLHAISYQLISIVLFGEITFGGMLIGSFGVSMEMESDLVYDSVRDMVFPFPYYYIILIVVVIALPVFIIFFYLQTKTCKTDPNHWYCPRSGKNG